MKHPETNASLSNRNERGRGGGAGSGVMIGQFEVQIEMCSMFGRHENGTIWGPVMYK